MLLTCYSEPAAWLMSLPLLCSNRDTAAQDEAIGSTPAELPSPDSTFDPSTPVSRPHSPRPTDGACCEVDDLWTTNETTSGRRGDSSGGSPSASDEDGVAGFVTPNGMVLEEPHLHSEEPRCDRGGGGGGVGKEEGEGEREGSERNWTPVEQDDSSVSSEANGGRSGERDPADDQEEGPGPRPTESAVPRGCGGPSLGARKSTSKRPSRKAPTTISSLFGAAASEPKAPQRKPLDAPLAPPPCLSSVDDFLLGCDEELSIELPTSVKREEELSGELSGREGMRGDREG